MQNICLKNAQIEYIAIRGLLSIKKSVHKPTAVVDSIGNLVAYYIWTPADIFIACDIHSI